MKITQEKTHPINRWHQSLEKKDLNILYDLLADDFQFYSPVVFKPKDKQQLIDFLNENKKNKLEITIIGAGSNTLIRDGGFDGIII